MAFPACGQAAEPVAHGDDVPRAEAGADQRSMSVSTDAALAERSQPNGASDDARPNSDDARPNSGDARPNSGDARADSGDARPDAGDAQAAAAVTPPGLGQCQVPAGARLADVEASYAKWKSDILTSDGAKGFVRPRRPNSSGAAVNSTVSEGIGYGMLMAAYMNDQAVFDNLWKYEQLWLDGHGLMNWYIDPAGTMPLGTGAATDGDEDMAFALIMAAKTWGGRGSLSADYLTLAKKQIDLIWTWEVDHTRGDLLMPGDNFSGAQIINISYFAPAFYRTFAEVSGNADWMHVVDSSYRALESSLSARNGNSTNGLVPAWSTPEGNPQAPSGTGLPTHYQLDSCRTPFRIAQDYCWHDEPRAGAYLDKINSFYLGVGAGNIVDGYDLNGTPHPEFASAGSRAAAFLGPAGVGAMASGRYRRLLDDAYADVATLKLLAGSQYYNTAWTGLSLLMMSGRFVDLTRRP
jgi:hypothetical protein